MFFARQWQRVRAVYGEYPQQFWVLIGAAFIDSVGGALLYPFFALYITAKFGVGMTEVGIMFGAFSLASLVGNTLGGAMTDRFGRKGVVIFGLVCSALSTLVMGFVEHVELFIGAAVFAGLFANAGGPARQAMVADLLPPEKRAQGFGVLRVSFNLAATLGPAIGGILASKSYLTLFIIDGVASSITALVAYRFLTETKPQASAEQKEGSILQTVRGYGDVFRDGKFMLFVLASILMLFVYVQMHGTLAVYLRDTHGIAERYFGYILSLNAAMVVLFQFYVTRRIEGKPPFLMLALGMLLYVVGFGLYGLVSSYVYFLLAMVIITVGEMLVAPVSQAVVADMSPEDMRGRYMAVNGLTWAIPNALGLYLAGLVMDNFDPRWVWYAAAVIGLLPTAIYYVLHRQSKRAPAEVTVGVRE
jgi:MFS family permease